MLPVWINSDGCKDYSLNSQSFGSQQTSMQTLGVHETFMGVHRLNLATWYSR